MKRTFRFKKAGLHEPCPKCGNSEIFYAHAEQCAEDCCDIWISCLKCGYDPFHDYETVKDCSSYCIEDVLGSLDKYSILTAMDSWDDLIRRIYNG